MPIQDKNMPKEIQRPKIAPLSVLPVFFNLQGANVLMVGQSEAAAWKVELLLAAGAQVHLVGKNLGPQLQALITEQGGAITHSARVWHADDLKGVRLALGDFENIEGAEKFAKAARRAGTPVNIIDKPDFCDFQFGSIVNRSPVVVSISTSGAAPMLAQSIRTHIETLLPVSIGAWAGRAKHLRAKLAKAAPDLANRKAIWRNFSKAAFSQPVGKIDAFFKTALQPNMNAKQGRVTLVGAGPGDAELLTIKAVRALQSADIILFDKLVSDDVLELARREARRMLVGKRGGQASCRQDDINALMLKLARQGKHVVRLKSGDPMIFGRAGEEIKILEDNDIEVNIVPGITSAMAAASSLGISLTHRDCAQSVKFITAHSRKGELPDIDWRACADAQTTLMVYMGARTAPKLAQALISDGASPDMAVLIAKGVSRESEEISYHRLAELLTLNIDRTQPVLLGIGQVFENRLAESMGAVTFDAPSKAYL